MTQPYPDHIRLGPGEDSVILLDQTQLPNRLEERQVRSLAEIRGICIKTLIIALFCPITVESGQ